ncbi:bf52587f-3f38-4ac0-b322-3d19f552eaa5-CDS [Sclerotinia trifoliorum]|uniref:Bf52587f-3f38-4ac0-b322-3d19f552eaa5-CDS n=1 Tax=Sclerotinia trifoliorum TaxID=28548 RepID=A0A8H2ZNS1_9HELO|nr:bf52587f-3f38-4ac0-b322-3d19f552eaa5-CDS [Sclerotinia trifoliorum]
MSSSTLFTPLKVGTAKLQHRIAMAPLTRFRADENLVPLPMVSEYYTQRASVPGTHLITEATFIAPPAGGYSNVPGIFNKDQITAWKKVTDSVHAKKSYIWMQLWALGRAADPTELAKSGYKVKSASDIAFEGGAKPEALTEAEIKEYIGFYAQAAKNAIEAGFDGVEIHGANGYLVDQFLQDTSNQRTDSWGGSIENRARFGLEVAKAVVEAVGADKTAIRLSPFSEFQGMKMADPVPQFSYFVQELKKLNIAYLHVVESRIDGNVDSGATEENVKFIVDIWDGTSPVFIAGGFSAESAKKTVDEEYKGKDIVIVFGRYFIANPDLPFRVKEGIEFRPYDRNLFYNKTQAEGYTTYTFSKEFEAQQKAIEASA